jgi:hypothetical protein
VAREKAAVVAKSHAGRLVLGADQTLTLGAKRFSSSESRVARVQRQVREPFLMSNGEHIGEYNQRLCVVVGHAGIRPVDLD